MQTFRRCDALLQFLAVRLLAVGVCRTSILGIVVPLLVFQQVLVVRYVFSVRMINSYAVTTVMVIPTVSANSRFLCKIPSALRSKHHAPSARIANGNPRPLARCKTALVIAPQVVVAGCSDAVLDDVLQKVVKRCVNRLVRWCILDSRLCAFSH